jgi:hypothetical protein
MSCHSGPFSFLSNGPAHGILVPVHEGKVFFGRVAVGQFQCDSEGQRSPGGTPSRSDSCWIAAFRLAARPAIEVEWFHSDYSGGICPLNPRIGLILPGHPDSHSLYWNRYFASLDPPSSRSQEQCGLTVQPYNWKHTDAALDPPLRCTVRRRIWPDSPRSSFKIPRSLAACCPAEQVAASS